ncbi:MAG: hypothetical protein SFW62_01870 [Alphaproteobacteria bacterium]|nr:hypothetical protein [Alphaproteobacteria bacterium]
MPPHPSSDGDILEAVRMTGLKKKQFKPLVDAISVARKSGRFVSSETLVKNARPTPVEVVVAAVAYMVTMKQAQREVFVREHGKRHGPYPGTLEAYEHHPKVFHEIGNRAQSSSKKPVRVLYKFRAP